MPSSTFYIWLGAIRPRTLPLAIISIVVGSGLAFHQKSFSPIIFSLAVITALLLQILSNLANDYGDATKGTDNANRIGPKRVMQQGLISRTSMQKALAFNIALIIIFGSTLLLYSLKTPQHMLSFLLLGGLAILAALFYTIGNKPYGYQGLGDFSVLLFFGWLGVLGSFYLHAGKMDLLLLLPATASGLLAVSVLNINNLRDIDNDRISNKRTLVVRIGAKNARAYHLLLLILPFCLFSLFIIFSELSIKYWLFLFATPFSAKHGKAVWKSTSSTQIGSMLAQIVKLTIITNLLFILPFLL